MTEHDALIVWSAQRVAAGLPSVEELIEPAWLSELEHEGWSLVCRFARSPASQGNPTRARVRFLAAGAPHGELRPGAKLRLFDGFSGSVARVTILDGSAESLDKLSALESAILQRMASRALDSHFLRFARFSRRELTGAGSFTYFEAPTPTDVPSHISLDCVVSIPGVLHGLGATLFLAAGSAHCLEIYTFGEEVWGGSADRFELDDQGQGPAS